MSLADDIYRLRDQTLLELTAAHDYYGETIIAWSIVQDVIRGGQEFDFISKVTSTHLTQNELLTKSYRYVLVQLHETTFQQFLALFESFFFDFLRLWLTTYPQSLGKKTIDFKTILEAADKDALTQMVVTKELIEVLYDRPAEWFNYLNSKAKLGCPTDAEIEQIAEAKASRDVLTHNRGIVNEVYHSKAGNLKRFELSMRLEISEAYHRQTWNLIRKIVTDMSNAAIAKLV